MGRGKFTDKMKRALTDIVKSGEDRRDDGTQLFPREVRAKRESIFEGISQQTFRNHLSAARSRMESSNGTNQSNILSHILTF